MVPTSREQPADSEQELLALDRVGVDDHALLGGERPWLVDDLAWDLDLADVVEERGELGLAARRAGRV